MKKAFTTLLAAFMLVGLLALPASANDDETFVDFVVEQADKNRGRYNVISQTVLALVDNGVFTDADVAALSTADLTAFLPTDVATRRLAADLEGKRWWQIKESEVIPILVGALGLDTIGEVVKYHVFAGGKVDYRTARSLDDNRRNGTEVFIDMYNGGKLGIDRRGPFLQLDDSGDAGFGSNNPFVVQRNVDAGNGLVHGISEILLP